MKNEIDMLHGPLFMKIIMFTLPLAASSILQQLFNSVDVAVVGRFASSQALAAVGSNAPVISLLINLFLESVNRTVSSYNKSSLTQFFNYGQFRNRLQESSSSVA